MTTCIAGIRRTSGTGLLVSVRDAVEARAALAAGADLIDVKEPSRGALGAADRSVVEQIVSVVEGRATVSVALGELLEGVEHTSGDGFCDDNSLQLMRTLPEGVSLAKLGLAGCGRCSDWPDLWRKAVNQLPSHVAPVAVVYADWQSARAPRPEDVLRQAGELGCRAVLVDTFDKSAGDLTTLWPIDALSRFADQVRAKQMAVVLAGSLSAASVGEVLDLGPDLVAVRGAVCERGRTGQVSQTLVQQLAQFIAAHYRATNADNC